MKKYTTQKLTVAQNIVFQWVKNISLIFQPKLMLFIRSDSTCFYYTCHLDYILVND